MHHKIPSTLIALPLLCLLILAALWFAAAQAQPPLAAAQAEPAPATSPNPVATQAQVEKALQSAPVMFIENVGQFDDDDARFHVRGGDYDLWLADDALWMTLLEASDDENLELGFVESSIDQPTNSPTNQPTASRSSVRTPPTHQPTNTPRKGVNLKLSFVDANPQPEIEPFNLLETKMNYFLGNDEDKWRSNVPVWGGVRYKNIYPGIDLELTSENGRSVQRFVVHSRANFDAAQVQLRVEGAEEIELLSKLPSPKVGTPKGEQSRGAGGRAGRHASEGGEMMGLTVKTAIGDVTLPLFTLITPDGTPLETNGTPSLNNYRIQAPFAPASQASFGPEPDSTLSYSTFIGGSGEDIGRSLALDDSGNAIVTGWTYSSDFPTTAGSMETTYNGGNTDIFVLQWSSTGDTLIYSTFIGGSSTDYGTSLALDSAGNVVLTGGTASSDFPATLAGYDTTHNGSSDAFVLKLNAAGNALLYNTFIGGSFNDDGESLALDNADNVVVTGETTSSNFPTTAGSYDTTFGGGVCNDNQPCNDTFVFKLSSGECPQLQHLYRRLER